MSIEKLDSFNKILLATSTINYMASACDRVNEQCKTLCNVKSDTGGALSDGIKERTKALEKVLRDLNKILESFGNFLDGRDCVCMIDTRVYKVPLEILLHGMDEVDKNYEEKLNNELTVQECDATGDEQGTKS